MPVSVVTPPADWPVLLADAKRQLSIETSNTDDDTLINRLIVAAIGWVENYTGLALAEYDLAMTLPAFEDEIILPRGPVSAVTAVKYYDVAGVMQTLGASTYETDLASIPPRILRAKNSQWPATSDRALPVRIEYTAGYDTDIPAPLAHAVLILVAEWYAVREDSIIGASVSQSQNAIESLLTNYRVYTS